MMYIFPHQFGLHDVFTSKVNATQRLEDYQSREEAMVTLIPEGEYSNGVAPPKLPRRLRGAARHLVRRLQILHNRCSYADILRHYCPTHLDKHIKPIQTDLRHNAANRRTSDSLRSMVRTWCCPFQERRARGLPRKLQRASLLSQHTPLVDLACPVSCASAYCQAVLSKIIPDGFWGSGDTLCHNKTTFLRKVHHFVRLRRFESMTLHEIFQGFKESQAVDDSRIHVAVFYRSLTAPCRWPTSPGSSRLSLVAKSLAYPT